MNQKAVVRRQVKSIMWTALGLALVICCGRTHAMFMFEETEAVPISRVFTNLQRRLISETNNFELSYRLARLHSMAFATNLTEIEVSKKTGQPEFGLPDLDEGIPSEVHRPSTEAARQIAQQHLTNAIALYRRALTLLRKGSDENVQRAYVLPTHMGLAWCLEQAGQREEALQAYRNTLRIAWRIEVTGDFHVKEWVKGVWNDVTSGKNPLHSRRQEYIGPGVCYTDEVIGYMLKLLDPVRDAREIADLRDKQKVLGTMGRAITPILVPLESDLPLDALVDPRAAVRFDLDGSEFQRQWGWITPKAAWLVYDAHGSGKITSALQLFGNVTFWIFWCDGYEALASLDADGNDCLQGEELIGLALWQDANRNGISEPGEVRPLTAYGIVGLSCESTEDKAGFRWNPRGVIFGDGSSRPTYDWIASSTP